MLEKYRLGSKFRGLSLYFWNTFGPEFNHILGVFFANLAEQSVFFEFFVGCSVYFITVRRMLKI
jgi:hypothetical protein